MAAGYIVMPILTAFAFSVLLGPLVIPLLKRLKAGQTVREDGPSTHLKKSGTPTMGGLLILMSILLTSAPYVKDYPRIIPILLLMLGFGMIGFIDDFIKIVLRRSMGLSVLQKMLLQILVTAVFAHYMVVHESLELRIPFGQGAFLEVGWLSVPLLFATVIGTANGTNFTDGLDGLASSVTILVATFFTAAAVGTNAGIFPVTCAAVGALLGFLFFNVHPASVFMGDTGSLALGGFVAGCAYMMRMPLFLLLAGFVYAAEVLSVILQVVYYKISGGKRIFRMAPVHHHLELCGWKETAVTALFSVVTAVLCVLALFGLS